MKVGVKMCGRYYIDSNNKEIKQIIDKIDDNLYVEHYDEIYPSNIVPIIIADNVLEYKVVLANWGLKNHFNSNLLINAKSETIFEKKTFKKAILNKRCLIPCTGFYEWKVINKNEKEKYMFEALNDDVLYLLGIYQENHDGSNNFVIITKSPNIIVEKYHNRMPAIINKNDINAWLNDLQCTKYYLSNDDVKLKVKRA
ncbi:SOS response-associated peptidase [Mycoplasma sp. P36-A1]|uniref:SOS response-associated peptidase n=1 Tax=Mycoplasma sp. P36-A1 TaxID=3252900 RepID=UPI003C30A133